MFHTRASLLNYSYHLLYNSDSVDEVGTLKYFRERYNRKNATPDDVMKSFQGSLELFESVGTAYIVTALLQFFEMDDVNDVPKQYCLPTKFTKDSKKQYFDNVLGDFVRNFINQRGQALAVEDKVKNYGLFFIYLTVMFLQLEDTAREGDGERNLLNQKLLIPLFKSLGPYSKYATEMFVAVSQVEATATERMAQELKWGYFTNWRGGPGRNIEEDMTQEIFNKISKSIVQRMGANKKMPAIEKVCRAVGGLRSIRDNFDLTINLHPESAHHHTRDSKPDELDMIKELIALKPFLHQNGRHHPSFPNIKRHPLMYLNVNEYGKWLDENMERLEIV